jgi:hypothetical protein
MTNPMPYIHPEIQRYLDGEIESITCQGFLRCKNPAVGMMPHPTLGDVPICATCEDYFQRMNQMGMED